MPNREVLKYPDRRLRKVAEEVKYFDGHLRALAQDMIDTMYENRGVGLAATQIGESLRVIVYDIVQTEKENVREPVVLVNPQIKKAVGKIEFEEGCLSVPGVREVVKRKRYVEVHAFNLDGEEIQIKGEGLLAVVLQHEIDHLDGILFIDRLSPAKKKLIKAHLGNLRD